MKNPLVSIIVPNYNHAHFLSKRIESVLNQTYQNTEIIILDDCSTDESKVIIGKYASIDNRITTIYNTKNTGSPFKQWKKGIDNAKGDLVWIAESDDFCENNFLEKTINIFIENKSIGVAYCQSNFVDSNGDVFGNHKENLMALDKNRWEKNFVIEGKTAIAEYMPIINIIPNASAAVFCRKLTNDVNWTKLEKYSLAGDRYFWIQLLSDSKLGFCAQSLNYFRFTRETVRYKKDKKLSYFVEIIRVNNEIKKQVKVPLRTRQLAIKQWLRHAKKEIIKNNNYKLLFVFPMLFLWAIIALLIVSHRK